MGEPHPHHHVHRHLHHWFLTITILGTTIGVLLTIAGPAAIP